MDDARNVEKIAAGNTSNKNATPHQVTFNAWLTEHMKIVAHERKLRKPVSSFSSKKTNLINIALVSWTYRSFQRQYRPSLRTARYKSDRSAWILVLQQYTQPKHRNTGIAIGCGLRSGLGLWVIFKLGHLPIVVAIAVECFALFRQTHSD